MQLTELLVNKNPTRINVEIASTFFQRLCGWMGKSSAPKNGLLLYPCNSIHTFLMKFPIDAVFLDAQNRVVKIYANLAPWRVVPIVPSAVNVLELPAGFARDLLIRDGDFLSFPDMIQKN